MKFKKSYNNSVALVEENGQELIVVGKGIGFGLKPGMEVDVSKIERRYRSDEESMSEISQIKEIKAQVLNATTKIIEMAEPDLNIKFTDNQYLTLADHINFAIQRLQEDINIGWSGVSRWEIKSLFPKEYKVAEKAVKILDSEFQITLPEEEIVLLTYHFVNAGNDDSKVQDTIKISKLISGIVDIVQYRYRIVFDTESFNYSRFITHLRALMVRKVLHQESGEDELDLTILELMKLKYAEAFETVESISTYLEGKAGWKLNQNDKLYLVLHIWRVTHRQN